MGLSWKAQNQVNPFVVILKPMAPSEAFYQMPQNTQC